MKFKIFLFFLSIESFFSISAQELDKKQNFDYSSCIDRVFINNLSGGIDNKGNLVIPAKFNSLAIGSWKYSEVCDNFPAPAESNKKFGFIDEKGNWLINPKYDSVSCFINGNATVKIGNNANLINSSGKILGSSVKDILHSGGGPIVANINDEVFYLDLNGQIKFKSPSDKLKTNNKDTLMNDDLYSYSFNEGIAPFKKGNLWGLIDYNGKILVTEQFNYVGRFRNGIAIACMSENYCGLINKNGKYLLNPSKLSFLERDAGFLSAQTIGSYNFKLINTFKNKIIAENLSDIAHCSEGICIVAKVQNKNECHYNSYESCWYAIDYDGKTLFKFPKNTVKPYKYSDGLVSYSVSYKEKSSSKESYKLGYLDKKGRIALKPTFETTALQAYFFKCNMARIDIDGKTGFINKKGDFIWNPRD